MSAPSLMQRLILEHLSQNGGTAKFSELLRAFRHWYFANSNKHLSALLSRMVKAGYLNREKRGRFQLMRFQKLNAPAQNQLNLFNQ